jgi:hypothetical protein
MDFSRGAGVLFYKRSVSLSTTNTGMVFEPQLVLRVTEKVPVDFFDLMVNVAEPPPATVCELGET